jgi:gamma-glutamylcyclotransferase (GGCT)/AIG2-like uncharacterized protein YtfP
MNPHLFVYGSLMSALQHPMGQRLAKEADLLGAASMPGRLYRIRWYPGLIESDVPADRVFGEIYLLQDPARSLAWLDEYEGLPAGHAATGEYERVERIARLDKARGLPAWVYLYRGDVSRLQRVADGRWASVPT